MGSIGREPSDGVSLWERNKTETARATNTNRLLTETLSTEGSRLMSQSTLSPYSLHPHVTGAPQIGGR